MGYFKERTTIELGALPRAFITDSFQNNLEHKFCVLSLQIDKQFKFFKLNYLIDKIYN